MKKILLFIIFCLNFAVIYSQNQYSVKNFKLKNGLEVVIDEDNTTNSVFGAMIVKAGAKNDPKDATGLAHYFEHIMFKGTDKIGTTNYDAEKILLDKITQKYDELAFCNDDAARNAVLSEISMLSQEAAQYAIPNEVDVILKRYGGANVNAGTSFDQTVYFNSFPAGQIERWLAVYGERFRNPVFRLFQSELETVYEEKNRMYDNPMQAVVFDVVLPTIFKNHPYGQQPLIGTTEHLKNPSITKMQEFFKTYYVANNMILLLCGNINADEIMPLVEKYFGNLPYGDVPEFNFKPEEDFNGETVTVKATPIPIGLLAYRGVPINHKDEIPLQIANSLLTNGSTGFLDKLQIENKIMMAQATTMNFNDLGCTFIIFMPKIMVQTVENAEKLIFEAVVKLKKGDFSEDDLNSIKLTKAKALAMQLENLDSRAQLLMSALSTNTPWDSVVNSINKINALTKDDIVQIANKYFDSNKFLLIKSTMGKLKSQKIDKPNLPALKLQNTEKKSLFAENLEEIPLQASEAHFIDFQKDIKITDLQKGVKLFITKNTKNEIFSVKIQYKTSNILHNLQAYIAEYMSYIAPEGKTFDDFAKELSRIGTSIEFSEEEDGFIIKITGFEDKFEESLQHLQELLRNPQKDETQIKRIYEMMKSQEKLIRETPSEMATAMQEFALFGEKSKYRYALSLKDLKKLRPETLVNELNIILSYSANVIYCGKKNIDAVGGIFDAVGLFANEPKDAETPYYKEFVLKSEPVIYVFNDKKAIQSQVYLLGTTDAMSPEDRNLSYVFNNYFGNGMSSIVFQEIREFRSLAYGASGSVVRQNRYHNNKKTFFLGWLQTQADKTNEAIFVLEDLFTNMPHKPDRLDAIKSGLIQTWESSYFSERDLGVIVAGWTDSGLSTDWRPEIIEKTKKFHFEQVVSFYEKFIKTRPHSYCIYGNINKINLKELKKLGKVEMLKFGDVVR